MCGNENCQIITETDSSGKAFSASKGCCGAILFGPIGILCGACGKGKKSTILLMGFVLIAEINSRYDK